MLVLADRNCDQVKEQALETSQRSLVKALIWQVLGLSVMLIVGYLYTGSLASGGAMAGINTLIGMVNYMAYERVWARVSWGRRPISS